MAIFLSSFILHGRGGNRFSEMTIAELEMTLPNGFHDAKLIGFEVNRPTGKAHFSLLLDVSDTESSDSVMRGATLLLKGLQLFRADGDQIAHRSDKCPLAISGFNPTIKECADLELATPAMRAKYFGFYVTEWNGFIIVAADDAEISWGDE